jgi:hypothetical protein
LADSHPWKLKGRKMRLVVIAYNMQNLRLP